MSVKDYRQLAVLRELRRDPVTFTQLVGPEQAQYMIDEMKYPHQRQPRPDHIKKLAEAMRAGTFRKLTQLLIAIYQGKYFVLDGQHRLKAIVDTGLPQLFAVVEIEAESDEELAELYSTTDRGAIRRPSDIYGAYALAEEFGLDRGYLINSLGAAVKYMATGCLRNGGAIPNEIQLMRIYAPYIKAYEGILEEIKVSRLVRKGALRASTVAVALLTLRFSAPKAAVEGKPSVHDFWIGALNDDGLKIGDPRKVAYQHLTGTRIATIHTARGAATTTPPYSTRWLGFCLNAYIAGREIRNSRVPNETAPLNIYGVPGNPDLWWAK